MKNKSNTFAAFSAKNNFKVFVCVAFFIATNTALYADNIRLSISNGCCATKPVIVLCGMEKDSLSSFKYFNFLFMQRTMKSESKVNNSTLTLPSIGTKSELQPAQTFNLPSSLSELQPILTMLKDNNMPVVMTVNIITNNNITLGESKASNISVVTSEGASAVSGHNNQYKDGETHQAV